MYYILLADIEVTAEHQTNLHSRLQQEAEKIRKWKVHTEIELKQKVINSCMNVLVNFTRFRWD